MSYSVDSYHTTTLGCVGFEILHRWWLLRTDWWRRFWGGKSFGLDFMVWMVGGEFWCHYFFTVHVLFLFGWKRKTVVLSEEEMWGCWDDKFLAYMTNKWDKQFLVEQPENKLCRSLYPPIKDPFSYITISRGPNFHYIYNDGARLAHRVPSRSAGIPITSGSFDFFQPTVTRQGRGQLEDDPAIVLV